jgi:hypothetical protein
MPICKSGAAARESRDQLEVPATKRRVQQVKVVLMISGISATYLQQRAHGENHITFDL